MGIFDKLGKALIEEVPSETNETITEETEYHEEEPVLVEAELSDVNTDTLIDDIYLQNNLDDKSKSIFKVEELIDTLPKEMVTETKKASVLSTLTVFGLTTDQVLKDADDRLNILVSVYKKINDEAVNINAERSDKIENLKKEIAALESEMSNDQHEIKISNDSIIAEVDRIKELIKFIGGNV